MLLHIRIAAYGGMTLLVVLSLACGGLAGGPGAEGRRTLAVVTGVRNAGVALVIVTGGFAGTPAVTAATAFGIFQTLVIAVLAAVWGRMVPRGATEPTTDAPPPGA